jgi:DNA-binding transcriptional MerR regulator/ubiquinone/menaquinone biosynthesis C-methylase UbiE
MEIKFLYQISEFASKLNISRTTLLYYEKLKLIQSKRLSNGYRVYSDSDLQKLRLIQQLQQGGLTLKECKACIDNKIDPALIKARLQKLDDEIIQKQQSRALLASLLGNGNENTWHEAAIKNAPQAYLDWLNKQGFNEREALRVKWLSKNMTQHEQYMKDFMTVFQPLERWGPGSESETLKALAHVPIVPKNILEVGCGKGLATLILANSFNAKMTSVDNEQSALDSLSQVLSEKGLTQKVKLCCASMTDLPFEHKSVDLIWSEAAAYIMGVENALVNWQKLLKDNGILVFSDLVLMTSEPSKDVSDYWQKQYPDIQTIETRRKQIKASGYEILTDFTFEKSSWDNYYLPLKKRVDKLKPSMKNSPALNDIAAEIAFYLKNHDEFGYQMFILQKII